MARIRRRRPLPPQHDAHMATFSAHLDKLIKKAAENRMKVFDAAPKRIRDETNYNGGPEGKPLMRWWDTLDGHQQECVLEGYGCPPPKPSSQQSIWNSLFG